MPSSTHLGTTDQRGVPTQAEAPGPGDADADLRRWGGWAGLAGVVSMIGAMAVVTGMGLPDASDVETLTDFDDIEVGRILEHFLYLGAVMLFALHALVLSRLLRTGNRPAALFGTAVAEFGLLIMAASSLLHVSTAPLWDLYSDPDATTGDRQAVEAAWTGAQSVFDTMLATGVLLVPIGMILLGIAMLPSAIFGTRTAWIAIGLGVVGTIGAVIAVVVPGSALSALSVIAIVVFHLITGWRTIPSNSELRVVSAEGEPVPLG